MDFQIELESYLEYGAEDDYSAPYKEARMVKNLCIYPDEPGRYDEPVFEVTINTLEDLMNLVDEVEYPIEINGRTITIKDRCY